MENQAPNPGIQQPALNPTPPQPNPMGAPQVPQTPKPKDGGALKFAVAALIIIVIIAAASYFLLTSKSGNGSVVKLAAILATGQKVSLKNLATDFNVSTNLTALSSNTTASARNLTYNSSYAGSGNFGLQISVVNISFPFSYNTRLLQNGNYSELAYDIMLHPSSGTVNLSTTEITTPKASYECSNQNQTLSLLGTIGGAMASAPNYECITQPNTRNEYSNILSSVSQSSALNSTLQALLSGIYINATSTKYTSYDGNSCIQISGYVSSNKIREGSAYSNSTISVNGPYSVCASASGKIYEFNFTMQLSVTASSIYGGNTTESGFLKLSGQETSSGSAPSDAYISTLPYPVVNGTCLLGASLPPEDYYATYVLNGYKCQEVDMNSSGYLRLNLAPSGDLGGLLGLSTLRTSSTTAEESARLLGLACFGSSSLNSTVEFEQKDNYTLTTAGGQFGPAASYFTPVNMTVYPDANVSIIANCPYAGNSSAEYHANLYGVFQENYSGTQADVLHEIGYDISVTPTIDGGLGQNQNTGTVSSQVQLTDLSSTSSYGSGSVTTSTSSSTNSSQPTTTYFYSNDYAYNYTYMLNGGYIPFGSWYVVLKNETSNAASFDVYHNNVLVSAPTITYYNDSEYSQAGTILTIEPFYPEYAYGLSGYSTSSSYGMAYVEFTYLPNTTTGSTRSPAYSKTLTVSNDTNVTLNMFTARPTLYNFLSSNTDTIQVDTIYDGIQIGGIAASVSNPVQLYASTPAGLFMVNASYLGNMKFNVTVSEYVK